MELRNIEVGMGSMVNKVGPVFVPCIKFPFHIGEGFLIMRRIFRKLNEMKQTVACCDTS